MRGIDEIDDANGWTGRVLCLMARCVTFLDEFNYINALKDKRGLNRNLQISASVLSNISRLIQSFQLANVSYEYAKLDGKYIREKGEKKEEISKEDYLINTFMDEYVAAQSQNN